jgi:hypothetical protein
LTIGEFIFGFQIKIIMATADVIPKMPTSFVYEELISKVQAIQQQIMENIKFIDERKKNELKSRSLTFVDPYGNLIINKYMDHESISTVLKKYKKDYVPKYLQQWIKIGTMDRNVISPLSDCEMKSIVSKYEDGHQFITYGEVIVWAGNYESLSPRMIVLRVLLTDNMEKIKIRLKEQKPFTNIELKSIIINQNTPPNNESWTEGRALKVDDTIMSCQLYQDNCTIMAKLIKEKVNFNFVSSNFT